MNSEYTDIAITMSTVLMKVKGFFGFLLSFLAAYALSLYVPVAAFVESLYLLVIIDLFLGSWNAKRGGKSFDMNKALLTMRKFILYPVAVMLAGHFEAVYSKGVPVTQVVAGTAAIFELRSVYGHISRLTGIEFWSVIYDAIKNKLPNKPKDHQQ